LIFKRNVWTVFYSVLYLIVFGLGFYEIFQLAVNASSIPVIYVGLFVVGIVSYLVFAYWIRRKRWLDFLQENRLILWIIELCLLVICTGAVYYFNSGQETIRGLLALVMLTLIYGCARLLAGRIGGMGALVMGFFFVISLTQYSFDRQQYLDVICFLVPYFCFLFVTKVVCRIFYRNNFKLLFSYGVLAVVFAVFISLNVMVSALLLGCMCSLLFGTAIKKDGSIMNDGKIAVLFVLLFTAIVLIVIKVFEPALCTVPGTAPDSQYDEIWNMEGLTDYLISKYTRAVRFVYRPFQTTQFPLVMVFLGWLSGFRCIRKKYSSIGPFCLTYLFLLVYYMIFNEIGTHFYYMTYFLPIFAAYGLNSTLVAAEDMQELTINVKPGSEKPVETKSIQENSGDKTMRRFRASGRKKEKSESAIPEWSLMPGNEELVKESQEKNEETVSAEAGDTLIPDSVLPTALEEEAEPKQTESFSFDYSNFDSDDNNSVLGGNLSAASQEQDAFLQEESSIPSLMSDEGMMEFESAQEEVSESVTPAEDEQLGSFLDRLDISENIRRMNESAREDMADVIERDDMTNDLSEAIPAEEFHFETVEPEEPEELVLEEEPEEMETPVLEDMPEEMETPALEDMPEEVETPALEDMPEEMETPALEDMPEEMETPALEDMPEEVETPVLEDEDDNDSLLSDSLFSHSFEDSTAESLFEEAPDDSSIQGELPDSVKDAEDYLDGIEADNETDLGEEATLEEPEEKIQLEPVTEKLILDSVMDDSIIVGNSDFEDVIQDVEDVDPKSKRRKSAKKKSAKYEKPSFKMDPVTKPLTGSDKVREYEKVPTISELEKKWREINGVGGDDQLEELMARRKSQMQSAEETNHTFMDFSMKQDEQKPVEEVGSETTEAVSEEPQALHLESVESVNFDSDLIPEEDFLSFEEDEASEEPAVEEVSEPEEELTFEEPALEEVSEPEEELTFEEPAVEEVSEPEEELTFEEPALEEVSEPEEELTFEEPAVEEVSELEEELTFEEPAVEEVSEMEEELTFEEPAVEEVSEPELETAITVEAAQEDVFSAVEDDLFEEEQPVINLDKQVKGAGYESACEEQVSDTQEVVRTICDEKRVYYRVTIR